MGSFSNKKSAVHRRVSHTEPKVNNFETNHEIAELFRILSNLQQACPLLDGDSWKAYSSRVVSGRIMHLDFEITNDPECFTRLLKVSGIGSRTVAKIHEYFQHGNFDRIVEFQKDPQRIAMKNLMGIWGVGEKTVSFSISDQLSLLFDLLGPKFLLFLPTPGAESCSDKWLPHHRGRQESYPSRKTLS